MASRILAEVDGSQPAPAGVEKTAMLFGAVKPGCNLRGANPAT